MATRKSPLSLAERQKKYRQNMRDKGIREMMIYLDVSEKAWLEEEALRLGCGKSAIVRTLVQRRIAADNKKMV